MHLNRARWMTRACFAVLALVFVAPFASAQPDPHATGARKDQWRVIVAGTPAIAFDAAMLVLSDSGYSTTDARKESGIIKTAHRREAEVQRGGRQLKTMLVGRNAPVSVQLLILAKGADSTVITITGEELLGPSADIPLKLNERDKSWRFIRAVGEAVLAVLGPPKS